MEENKKGITVKVDAELHAEVKRFIEENNMTMAEFVSRALENELHPKINETEVKGMEKMRTLAFQVPEEFFQKVKDYLRRNNISQKDFVVGLIENEIERDLAERAEKAAALKADNAEYETEEFDEEDEALEEAEVEIDEDIEETEDELESEMLEETDENDEELDDESEETEEADEAFDDEIENEDQDNEYEDDESIEDTDEEDEELNEDEFDEEDQDDDYDEDEDEEESEGFGLSM